MLCPDIISKHNVASKKNWCALKSLSVSEWGSSQANMSFKADQMIVERCDLFVLEDLLWNSLYSLVVEGCLSWIQERISLIHVGSRPV